MQTTHPITTKELRDNLAEILERVAIGKQTFIVSKFGRQKAKIVPLSSKAEEGGETAKKTDLRKSSFYGMWKDRADMKDSATWVSELRKKQSLRIKN
jgi:prevent-host-death family protein